MRFSILLALLIGFTECEIGKKCYDSADCSTLLHNTRPERTQDCEEGICRCKPAIEVKYNAYTLKPECDFFEHSKMLLDGCKADSCEANASCEDIEDKGPPSKKSCYCNDGFLRVGDSCIEANHQRVLQRCYYADSSSGGFSSCDLENYSYCSDGRCICFDTFFANTTSGICEPMKDYLEAYNLTEYRVKPNEYCKESHQCITGLVCRSHRCSCPEPCAYNSEAEICDCGEISPDAPTAPIVLGVLLGLLIMVFWIVMIKRTYEKFAAKKRAGFPNLVTAGQSSPDHNTIALSPISRATASSAAATPFSPLTVESLGIGGPQSTVPSNSLPYKPGGDASILPPPPPQASLYCFHPPYPTHPDTPLTFTTSTPDPVNPPPMENASVPLLYPSKPTDSVSALPYPSSPSTLPYHPDPVAPYPTNPSLPYPVSPYGAPAAMPNQEPEGSTAPPAYNPSYP